MSTDCLETQFDCDVHIVSCTYTVNLHIHGYTVLFSIALYRPVESVVPYSDLEEISNKHYISNIYSPWPGLKWAIAISHQRSMFKIKKPAKISFLFYIEALISGMQLEFYHVTKST